MRYYIKSLVMYICKFEMLSKDKSQAILGRIID
jgi:hypothetical protein